MPMLDFAILTGLTEEFKYLQSLFPDLREITVDGNTWYRTRVQADNGTHYELVLGYQDQMGPLDSHGLAVRVIDQWDPAYILLLGIAGVFDRELNLGDVIVGQQIFHYDPKAVKDSGLEYRPAGYPGGVALVRQVHAVSVSVEEFEQWQKSGAKSAADKAGRVKLTNKVETASACDALREHSPSIYVGTVASGTDVIKSEKKKEELLRLHGKLLGTEMEGCGVMHAAFFHRETPTQALLIKGISDRANADKAKLDAFNLWRELAVENAARLALAIIKRGRLKPQLTEQFDLDPTSSSIDVARQRIPQPLRRGFALLGFPRLIVPRGPLTDLSISIRAVAGGKDLSIRQRVVEFSSGGHLRHDTWKENEPLTFHATETIDRQPVGVYVLLAGTADRIVFEVSSASEKLIAEWVPGL